MRLLSFVCCFGWDCFRVRSSLFRFDFDFDRCCQAIEDYISSKYPDCAFARDDLKSAMQMCIRANLIQPVNKYKTKFKLAPKPEAAIRSRSVEGVALVHSCSDLLKMADTGCEQRGQIASKPQPPTVAYDWAFDMGAKASSILATENFVYAGDESGLVVKLARKDGKQLLQSRLSAGVKCMVVDDEFVFAGTNDGCVYDLSLFERPRLVAKVEDVSQFLWLDVYKGKMAASDSKGQVAMLDYEGETIWKRRSSGNGGYMVRIDDTGAWHSRAYTSAWLTIAFASFSAASPTTN